MGGSSESGERLGDSGVIEVTGKIMVVALVLLFFVVIFVFCLHLYAKWFWYRRQENATTTTTTRRRRRRRRRRFDFAAGHEQITVSSSSRPGLDPWVLKTIPVMVFDPKEFEDGLECAVCLCEISGGEKARLLPKCNHGFHVDCIDMWFQSHSTCPLCRNPVANQIEPNPAAESALDITLQGPTGENSGVNPLPAEAPNFPANVLIWGNEAQVSTFGRVEESNQGNAVAGPSGSSSASSSSRPDGISVIDVPSQISEEEEPKSPAPTRLRSLKRLLSGNNRRVNPSSPRNLDLEQGGRGPI